MNEGTCRAPFITGARLMAPTEPNLPRLVTIGVIASELGEPMHRVRRVLESRVHIRPKALAGMTRLYGSDAIAMVRHELNAVDARRMRGTR